MVRMIMITYDHYDCLLIQFIDLFVDFSFWESLITYLFSIYFWNSIVFFRVTCVLFEDAFAAMAFYQMNRIERERDRDGDRDRD